MPFTYDPYRSPYAESIAGSIAAPGLVQAQGVLAAGQAQAQGQQQSGAIWGNAVGNLGQIAGQAIQTYNSPASKLTRVMKQTPKIDLGNGVMGYDVGTISDALAKQGADPTEAAKHLSDINESFQQVYAVKLAAVTRGAVALRAAGGDPELALDFLDTVDKNHLYPTAQTAQLRAMIKANPTPETVNKILTLFAGPEKFENAPAGSMARSATTGALIPGTMVPEKPVAPTRASLAAAAAAGDKTAQAALDKMTTVPTKDEFQTFKESYPKTLGATSWETLTPAQQTAGLAAYTKAKQDPAMVALQQQSLELGNALKKIQEGQQPTADDAKTIAQQLIDHKMAPSQLQLFGGFGTAGAAFKRMVGVEALKLDPNFDWEQSESDYQFGKSAGFQASIRFMDSVQESMPQLLKNAKALANGDFRSLNAVINAGKNEFNSVNLKKFQTDTLLVGDEVAKILQGGGTGSATSDAKLTQAQKILSTSDSVPAIAGALEEINALLSFRRKSLTRGTYLERQTQSAPDAIWIRDKDGKLVKQ